MTFTSTGSDPTQGPQSRLRLLGTVRLWHFIALPMLAMALMILVGRGVEMAFMNGVDPGATRVFYAVRALLITVVMASVVAWLAVSYRRQYERELQRRNKQLEETRDFLSSIIRGCGEGIVTLDASGRVSSWNRAAERIFGWTAEEMIGRTFRRLLPDDPRIVDERNEVGRRVRAGETVRDYQTTRLRKDGATVVVRITWAPIYTPAGEFDGVVGIVLDVTAETEIKRRLLEQERLAAVGEMAAQVAHEVRNPLAGIRGACEVIFRDKTPANVRSAMGGEVLQQIDRLNRTVEGLLQFARPRMVEQVPTDLHDLINRVANVLLEDPRAIGVILIRDFAADLPIVHVDPSRMEQVFYNLFSNAFQMMGFQGTVTVSTTHEDGWVQATVRDTGPGIPPEVGDRIFKPFVTTRTSGTGLGLAIVHGIIDAHGGSIAAVSPTGGGAEFSVRLPLATEHAQGPSRR